MNTSPVHGVNSKRSNPMSTACSIKSRNMASGMTTLALCFFSYAQKRHFRLHKLVVSICRRSLVTGTNSRPRLMFASISKRTIALRAAFANVARLNSTSLQDYWVDSHKMYAPQSFASGGRLPACQVYVNFDQTGTAGPPFAAVVMIWRIGMVIVQFRSLARYTFAVMRSA